MVDINGSSVVDIDGSSVVDIDGVTAIGDVDGKNVVDDSDFVSVMQLKEVTQCVDDRDCSPVIVDDTASESVAGASIIMNIVDAREEVVLLVCVLELSGHGGLRVVKYSYPLPPELIPQPEHHNAATAFQE